MPIQILLADDHVLVRQALRFLLERAGMAVTGGRPMGRRPWTWPRNSRLTWRS